MTNESIQVIASAGEQLVGVFHPASESATQEAKWALVMVVGGAQTRVGAQRLYVHVARFMALHGVAVLRFECRGLEDGSGPWPGIQTLAPDISAAIDQCLRLCPGVDGVMLWGLSDGATAAMLYAVTDTRVKSLFLVNPYVDNQREQARAMVRNYYLWRVFTRRFWRKVFSAEWSPLDSLRAMRLWWRQRRASGDAVVDLLALRIAQALRAFSGRSHIVLGLQDLTGQTFLDWFSFEKQQHGELNRVSLALVNDADHSFTAAPLRDQLLQSTLAAVDFKS